MLLDRLIAAQVNRIRRLVSKLYNRGLDRDLADSNPCWRVTAPAPNRQRGRVLSEHEIRMVWKACIEMDSQYRSLFHLQLLTAQRMGELRMMRWQALDLEAGWWTIPGDMVKDSRSHRVLLTPLVFIPVVIYSMTGGIHGNKNQDDLLGMPPLVEVFEIDGLPNRDSNATIAFITATRRDVPIASSVVNPGTRLSYNVRPLQGHSLGRLGLDTLVQRTR